MFFSSLRFKALNKKSQKMDRAEKKSTIFLNGQIFIQKKLFAVGIEAQVQNQRTFCADSPIFWENSSRIWRKSKCTFRTNRISPSQNRLPQFGIYRDFSQFQRKSLSFPPQKKQTKREGTWTLETLGPTARSHPKRRWWHKRSAAVYRHPMERNQWRRCQIQPLFPSEHKGPLMFLREFLFWKKVKRFVFCWGGPGCGRCWEVVVWGRM